MFASYTGKRSRSLSTADVYRIDSQDDCCTDDDAEMPEMMPRMSFSTLRRQIRRPTTRPPPVPPKRSDSFCAAPGLQDSAALHQTSSSRVRSYLSDDVRRQFEVTAMARESQRQQQQQSSDSSPRSSNFVKKLVATLERRQKDNTGTNVAVTHDIFKKRSFRELSRDDDVCTIAVDSRLTQAPGFDLTPRYQPSKLEKLREAENEGDDFDSSSDADDYFSDMWPQHESSSRLPVICAYPTSNNAPGESKQPGNRRSWAKNVFASLINWRIGAAGKSLPKGSRHHDYYATRESLGEEMRAFRRDTMPRLMEHAALNSRLPDLMLFKQQHQKRSSSSERPRRDTQDFAKLIKRSTTFKQQQHQQREEQPSPRSLATIHPIYGSNKAASISQLHLLTRNEPSSIDAQQPPPPSPSPPPPLQTCTSPISPDEHLMRPSRLRDLEKRMSQDYDACNNQAAVQLRSSALYDVPRSNRPVVVQEYAPATDTAHHYQNIGQSVSDDQRLGCPLFTTF